MNQPLYSNIPQTGYLRLPQILGSPKSNPPIAPLIPVCRTTWWKGVKTGRFPKAHKLSENVTAWKAEDIRDLIQRISSAPPTN